MTSTPPSLPAVPAPLLEEFRTDLIGFLGLPVVEAGQRIDGATVVLGAEHLSVLSAESAGKISSALADLGLSSEAVEGDLFLMGSLHLSTADGLWVLSGPDGSTSGYEYTLTGEGEDPVEVAACEAVFAGLVGDTLQGVLLEADGSLVLSFSRHTLRIWPPSIPATSSASELASLFGLADGEVPQLQSWSLMTEDRVWLHVEGVLASTSPHAAWGTLEASVPLVEAVSVGTLPPAPSDL